MAKSSGNTGGKFVGNDSSAFSVKVKPPANMTKEAKKVWIALIATIPADNIIPSDIPLMEAYCETTVMYRKAVQLVAIEGASFQTLAGGFTTNPNATWADKCSSKMTALAGKLRLAPSARQELTSTKGKPNAVEHPTELGKMIYG